MTGHLPVLIFFVLLFAAVSMPVVGHWKKHLCRPIAVAAIAAGALLSIASLDHVLANGAVRYSFSGWSAPIGIEWLADSVSSIMVLAVCLLALLCLVHGSSIDRRLTRGRTVPFYTIVLLLTSGLVGLVYAADLFNVFVFLEVVAISAYALVALPGGPALVAAFRYLILGTLGASCYLLGVGYFYAATGTLNIADLSLRVPELLDSKAVVCGLIFMFIGLGIKMALLPLHGWLPSAYNNAPDLAVPMLAGLLTKVSLLVWVRILFWTTASAQGRPELPLFELVSVLGALAAIAGGCLALYQQRLKRIFAYGGIAHIGLVLIGVGQMNSTGLAGGLFYLMNDAVMQFGLFALAGVVAKQYGIRTLEQLARAKVRNPWVLTALIVVAVGMVGFPPTGGFFGKWQILLATLSAENFLGAAALILTTLLTIAYFVRIFERVFQDGEGDSEAIEVPIPHAMRISLLAPAAAVVALGFFSSSIIAALRQSIGGLGL